jgi:DNA-binding transcriptional ArsR family regulator
MLFGSAIRTRILTYVALTGETYPTEVSRVLGIPLLSAQRVLNSLELTGAIASRLVGRVRLFGLNPTWFAAKELKELLLRLAQADTDLTTLAATVRRRPRRAGKSL